MVAHHTLSRMAVWIFAGVGVLAAAGLFMLLRWILFWKCDTSMSLSEQDGTLSDASEGDEDDGDGDAAAAAIEMQALPPLGGVTAEWEPPKGLSPGDVDYRNRFIRGGL